MGNLPATRIPFNGGSVSTLERFTGKVLLAVNVACAGGSIQQYAGLQELQEIYRDSGLEILGVPATNSAARNPAPMPTSPPSAPRRSPSPSC